MNRFRLTLLIALLASFFLGSLLVIGQDDQGNPNDPNTNERANACYDDGTMASKCDTEWEWICGWFMIRFDAGLLSKDEIPMTCRVLLPAEPQALEETPPVSFPWPPAGCYYSSAYTLYLVWNGNQTQGPYIDMTWDGSCKTPPHTGVGGFLFVSAANPSDADAICTTRGYKFIDEVSSSSDTGAWPIYRCQI